MSAVTFVPLARIRTSLAALRGGRTDRESPLAPLPLRAAMEADGTFEVLDGFKRLAQWEAEGLLDIPVVVEEVKALDGAKGFNANTGEYVDMIQAGIVDPTKVTRSALQNAASVASLMLTTETMVTEIKEKEEKIEGTVR